MGRRHHSTTEPTMMIHHIREVQLRLLAVFAVLIVGMIVGYIYYEPLFEFIKAPLNAPLHYMSPAGSFTFIIQICLMVGIVAALPVAVYNVIMFIQPALKERLSRLRVYLTAASSLTLALAGASFGYFVILPLALRFFFKFQVSGLVAVISADEYLRFVVGVIVTFVLIFQLPLLMSLADHITPLPPKKLLKLEKYIIVGSIFIGVVVPFALDPTVQFLIASPIVLLYNLSIGIILLQHTAKKHRTRKLTAEDVTAKRTAPQREVSVARAPVTTPMTATARPLAAQHPHQNVVTTIREPQQPRQRVVRSMDGTVRYGRPMTSTQGAMPQRSVASRIAPRPTANRRLITDMRGASNTVRRPLSGGAVLPVQNEQKGLA